MSSNQAMHEQCLNEKSEHKCWGKNNLLLDFFADMFCGESLIRKEGL